MLWRHSRKRALIMILKMHTSTAPFIIPPHVVECRIACRRRTLMRASMARLCMQAQRARYRAQAREFSSMPAQFSGQAWAK